MTHREEFFRKYRLNPSTSLSLTEISKLSKIPRNILQEVYERGYAAATSNLSSVRLKKDFSKNPDLVKYPRSARLSNEQWGMARVYSFVMKGKTWETADSDLAKRV